MFMKKHGLNFKALINYDTRLFDDSQMKRIEFCFRNSRVLKVMKLILLMLIPNFSEVHAQASKLYYAGNNKIISAAVI